MLKNNCFKKCMVFLLIFYASYPHAASAHEGHSHEAVITIGKKTVVHLQTILSTYQVVYTHLVKKDLHGIAGLARKLSEASSLAAKTEPDGAGRHMMEHVHAGAEGLEKAQNIQDAQKAFVSVSDALLPFFKSWPNHLKRNELKMCQCKHDGHCWLQPQNHPDACPYSADQAKMCSDIEEIK
ncbi:MAG: hypothetical protein L6Q53_02500 [Candidatus Brocadia sinica]|nr:hypothetical protein [Candidatus Brocadia sinica]NUO06862.1 hypothetical protein [Candidatus Brocadia sinica]